MKETKKTNSNRKVTSRQIVALAGVVLLILLYLVTLIVAIIDNSASASWFRLCLCATIALPLLIWIYAWIYSRLTGKTAIGDPEETGDGQETPEADTPPSDKTHRDS